MSKKKKAVVGSKNIMPLEVKNLNSTTSTADLYFYGEFDSDKWYETDVVPQDIIEILPDLENVKNINLYINSPGGNVYAAISILNLLSRLDAVFKVHIDGIAASAATYFLSLTTPENIVMPANTALYYHNPLGGGWGYAEDLRKAADDLDKHKEVIISMFTKQFNLTVEEISKIMDEETVVTAEMALEYGIITEISENTKLDVVKNSGSNMVNSVKFDDDKFKKLQASFNVVDSDDNEEPEVEKVEEVEDTEHPEQNNEPKDIDYSALENSLKLNEDYLSLY